MCIDRMCYDVVQLCVRGRLHNFAYMSKRSEQLLTGKKRERGTLMPCALRKCLMAAPTAVSSCRTASPESVVLLLMMISKSMPSPSITRLMALRLSQMLLVLKILNCKYNDAKWQSPDQVALGSPF